MRLALVVAPAHHLAMAVKPGKRRAVAHRNVEMDEAPLAVEPSVEQVDQEVAALAARRRDRHHIAVALRLVAQEGAALGIEQVDLVERLDHAALHRLAEAEVAEHGMDVAALRLAVRVMRIAHMNDEIGLSHLFERGAE